MRSKYQADSNTVHPIRLKAAPIALQGDVSGLTVNSDVKVKISKTNREFGIRPRGVTLYREISATEGGTTVTVVKYTFMPVLTQAAYNAATLNPESSVTYLGNTWKVLERKKEDY